MMDKLIADGTLTGYGAFTNLIHQEGEPTPRHLVYGQRLKAIY